MDFKNVVYFEENKTISLQEFHSTCQKSRVKFWNYSKSSKNVKNIVVSAASLVKVRRLLKTWISAVASSKRKQIPFVITILFIRINVNLSALLSECQQKKTKNNINIAADMSTATLLYLASKPDWIKSSSFSLLVRVRAWTWCCYTQLHIQTDLNRVHNTQIAC